MSKTITYTGDFLDYKNRVSIYRKKGLDFFTEEHGNIHKIVMGGHTYLFFDKETFDTKELPVLCRMVSTDAKAYISVNGEWMQDIQIPIRELNFKVADKLKKGDMLNGYDIRSCYWTIAYNKKFISEKTYLRGLKDKEARNIALGALNKTITRTYHKEGKTTTFKNQVHIIWYAIIQEMYNIYSEILDLVGMDNYVMWNTDAFYIHDLTQTRKIFDWADQKGLNLSIIYADVVSMKGRCLKVRITNDNNFGDTVKEYNF